jgi:hypothetical protein
MAALLDAQEEVPITERVMVAAIFNRQYALQVISVLLEKRGGNLPITGAVLRAATDLEFEAFRISRRFAIDAAMFDTAVDGSGFFARRGGNGPCNNRGREIRRLLEKRQGGS